MDNREVICYCAGVTKAQILEALDNAPEPGRYKTNDRGMHYWQM